MASTGRLTLPIAGWAVGGGLTALGMMGRLPGGMIVGALVAVLGWVLGGLSWAWALSEEHSQWWAQRALRVSASWVVAFLVAAYLVWSLSQTEVIFVPLGWILGFALGGAVGGFLTGLAVRTSLLRASTLAAVSAAAFGVAAYPGVSAGYILIGVSKQLIGDVLGAHIAVALGWMAGGALTGALAGLILALPLKILCVDESR